MTNNGKILKAIMDQAKYNLPKAQTGGWFSGIERDVKNLFGIKDEEPPKKVVMRMPQKINIKDSRKMSLTTGKTLNPNLELLSGAYPSERIYNIVKAAKQYGIDPYTALAIDFQETGWGTKSDAAPGHVKDKPVGVPSLMEMDETIQIPEQYDNFIRAIIDKQNYAKKLNITDPYTVMQTYNGLGKIFPTTEQKYHGFKMANVYGVPLPKEGIDMRKNPLYGRRVTDIRDNILKKNDEINKWVRYIKEQGGEIPKAQLGRMIAPRALTDSTYVKVPEALRKFQPQPQMTKEQVHTLNLVGQRKQARIADRKAAVNTKDKGTPYTLPSGETKKYSDMNWREKAYVDGKALEQRGRINPDSESFVDEFVNPLHQLTNIAGGLGQAPYQANQANSFMPYVSSLATPLVAGALGFDPLGSAMKVFKAPFKSEINWGAWNSEIPSNKTLLNEYHSIEKASKANGTWMKNPDGSVFQGTPEQFVQQNSQNFKKSYPEGFATTYRGGDVNSELNTGYLKNSNIIFTTADDYGAQVYNRIRNPYISLSKTEAPPRGITQLYMPQTSNKLTIDGAGEFGRRNYARLNVNQTPKNLQEAKILDDFKMFMSENYPDVDLSDRVMTDHFAAFLNSPKGRGVDRVEFKKIIDGTIDPIDVEVHNLNNKRQLKSMWNNNGMFDMSNSNIYKALIPAVGTAAVASQQKKQGGPIVDPRGQWAHPGKVTRIPSSKITMQGVNYPVYAQPNIGPGAMMYPGQEYDFGGATYVDEYPMMQDGGLTTPQAWEKAIRNVEHTIGNPSQWTIEGYNQLQNILNQYKTWRETTPQGKAVVDYHNEPNEYVVPLPTHLKNKQFTNLWKTDKRAWVDSIHNARRGDLDFVNRLFTNKYGSIPTPRDVEGWKPGQTSTHLLADDPGTRRVYPEVVNVNGKLQYMSGDMGWNHADDTKQFIEFPTAEQAAWYANSPNNTMGYKMGTGVFGNINPKTGKGYIPKKQQGGSIFSGNAWYAEGGTYQEEDPGFLSKIIPSSVQSLGKYLGAVAGLPVGNIVEKSQYNKEQLRSFYNAAMNAKKRSGKTSGGTMYSDYGKEYSNPWGNSIIDKLAIPFKIATDPTYDNAMSMGRFTYNINPDGSVDVSDQYNFNHDNKGAWYTKPVTIMDERLAGDKRTKVNFKINPMDIKSYGGMTEYGDGGVTGVKSYQKMLNDKYGAGLVVDGKWGKHTQEAYEKYMTNNPSKPNVKKGSGKPVPSKKDSYPTPSEYVDMLKEYGLNPLSKMGIEKAREISQKYPNVKFVCDENGCAAIAGKAAKAYGNDFGMANAWDYGNVSKVTYQNPEYKDKITGKQGALDNPDNYNVPKEILNASGALVGLNRTNNLVMDNGERVPRLLHGAYLMMDKGLAQKKQNANDSYDYGNPALYPNSRGYEHVGYMLGNQQMLHGTAAGSDHPAFYVIDNLKDGVSLNGYGQYSPVEMMVPETGLTGAYKSAKRFLGFKKGGSTFSGNAWYQKGGEYLSDAEQEVAYQESFNPVYNENVSEYLSEAKPVAAKKQAVSGKRPGSSNSIVDYLNKNGAQSDFATRKQLAEKVYGIANYRGTADQNIQLLYRIQNGAGKAQPTVRPATPAEHKKGAATPGQLPQKLSKAEQYIQNDPYFFADESDPSWIKAIDYPFTALRNLGARVGLDRDPMALAELLAMGLMSRGVVGKTKIKPIDGGTRTLPAPQVPRGLPAPRIPSARPYAVPGPPTGGYIPSPGSPSPVGFEIPSLGVRSPGYPMYGDGGIHINPANKGKFTASANRAGMGVQEFAAHVLANKEDYSSTQVKRANFARNASHWKHQDGGPVVGDEMDITPEQAEELRKQGYQFEII